MAAPSWYGILSFLGSVSTYLGLKNKPKSTHFCNITQMLARVSDKKFEGNRNQWCIWYIKGTALDEERKNGRILNFSNCIYLLLHT
jgi:hypothetical protein